jgi:hypothetical protein
LTPWKADQKYLESFEMWCWRRMEEITWTDLRNEEVLHRVKEESNVLCTINRRKDRQDGKMRKKTNVATG